MKPIAQCRIGDLTQRWRKHFSIVYNLAQVRLKPTCASAANKRGEQKGVLKSLFTKQGAGTPLEPSWGKTL